MFLAFLIVWALFSSAMITGFIKNMAYKAYADEEVDDENLRSDIFFTALGVIMVSNLIPFTLGALIGIYAIL